MPVTDHSWMKLGKLAPRKDRRTLKLAKYVKLERAPRDMDWSGKVDSFPMLLNDELGDCVIASSLHQEQVWCANTGREFKPTNEEALLAYETIGSYIPGDETTDNGCVMLDAMNYWRRNGIGGRSIDAFAAVNIKDRNEVKLAITIFGAVNIGLALPNIAQDQEIWRPVRGPDGIPGSWGGHCVPASKYSRTELTCITWGETKAMTWAFLEKYGDEMYVALSTDWLMQEGYPVSPKNGLNIEALRADLQRITA